MGLFVPPHSTLSTLLWVFLPRLLHVHGYRGHTMTQVFPATVLNTTNLECRTVDSRSTLELATMCGSHCVGMKANKDLGKFAICSCPIGPTWTGVTGFSIAPMTHLLTRKEVTYPGKWWWGWGYYIKSKTFFLPKRLVYLSDVLIYILSCHSCFTYESANWMFRVIQVNVECATMLEQKCKCNFLECIKCSWSECSK